MTDCILRLSPAVVTRGDVARIHGVDERISSESYTHAILFYHRVILRAQRGHLADDTASFAAHGDL